MPEGIIILASALICWTLAAWMFWKYDIGAYRSDYEKRQKKD